MDMIGIRFILFEEAGFVLGVVSLLLSLLTFSRGLEKLKRWFAGLMAVITIVLLGNYVDLRYIHPMEMCEVPNVEGIRFTTAQEIIRSRGLIERPIRVASKEYLYRENPEVFMQRPAAGTKVEKNSVIILSFEEIHVSNEDHSVLSIDIENWEHFNNGFYYEYPNPKDKESNIVIDFDSGISGSFKYSRPLTELEQANWFHGGRLCDTDGNEVGYEGNYPSFWSNPEGTFAVEFPKDLPSGMYTYELYLYVDGQYVSDSIEIFVG